MPTYDYQCSDCGYKFEKFQAISASVLKKCPKCGKMTLKRLIGTGAGVIFKGSGFYQTDYRSDAYKSAEKKETTSATNETKTETKTDTAKSAETKTVKNKEKTPAKKNKPKT